MHPDVSMLLAEERRHSLIADAASVRSGRRFRPLRARRRPRRSDAA
ncbi:MAG TPA: hypothetical protein VFZ77_16910 [Acidimicrobiales bacterium]